MLLHNYAANAPCRENGLVAFVCCQGICDTLCPQKQSCTCCLIGCCYKPNYTKKLLHRLLLQQIATLDELHQLHNEVQQCKSSVVDTTCPQNTVAWNVAWLLQQTKYITPCTRKFAAQIYHSLHLLLYCCSKLWESIHRGTNSIVEEILVNESRCRWPPLVTFMINTVVC